MLALQPLGKALGGYPALPHWEQVAPGQYSGALQALPLSLSLQLTGSFQGSETPPVLDSPLPIPLDSGPFTVACFLFLGSIINEGGPALHTGSSMEQTGHWNLLQLL